MQTVVAPLMFEGQCWSIFHLAKEVAKMLEDGLPTRLVDQG